ncbi:NAD(P)-dependent oxidoreductase [Streptomyces sp. TLI_171]|uniref:NAD-dependent epimerase/dehydratase family protein n=1 Tax=Streptomyces sp. TLI_171 TaxID=1938859 RepID=UPI000C560EA9|nr:NAD(P)-dependent oxidoreductase [Streptomyces sp. TLI_171]RKE21290.1 nucleoside-diphosphate-sugar epimerase [Streptomyces sp. TLI_171]
MSHTDTPSPTDTASRPDPRRTVRPRTAAGRSVLVLGASGYVGRHVCRAFTAAGDRVSGIARSAPADLAGVHWRPLDLVAATTEDLVRCLAGADVVVNAAGAVWGVTDEQMHRANAELPARLAEAVARTPRRPRLIHLGSVHEYGPGPYGIAVAETFAPAPVTGYGRTKLAGTEAVLAGCRDRGLDALVLRITNVSGPGTPTGSLLGMIAAHLARAADADPDGPPPLRLTPLTAERDFVDVRDVAAAVVAAARCPDSGLVINVGRGETVPVRALVDRLIGLSGVPVEVVEADRDGGRRGTADWQTVDLARARALLGWQPVRDHDSSLRDLLAAALPHRRPAAAGR